ncbi:MAG TPA: hypothetical protein VMT30_02490 [Candidatus Saccharimonadia bacterium]|nr:hypothetical protein [Candidatus Saccharimonadia bacterium]
MTTPAQIKALLAAHETGNPLNTGVNTRNGSNLRMIKRLAADGLLAGGEGTPYLITERGKEALRHAGHLKDKRSFKVRYEGEIWTITAPAAATKAMLAEFAARMFTATVI